MTEAAGPDAIRVLIVEDHELFARSLAAAISDEPGLQVVGIAGTGGAALRETTALAPDLILLDHRLPDAKGVELIQPLRIAGRPHTRIVMLTASTSEAVVRAALQAGAAGFVDKSHAIEQLAGVLRAAVAGEPPVDTDGDEAARGEKPDGPA